MDPLVDKPMVVPIGTRVDCVVDKPNIEPNEDEVLAKCLTKTVELDLVLFGTLAEFVGLILLVNEPISFLDILLAEVGELDFATDKPVVGAEILVSVAVLAFLEGELEAVDIGIDDGALNPLVVKSSIAVIVRDILDEPIATDKNLADVIELDPLVEPTVAVVDTPPEDGVADESIEDTKKGEPVDNAWANI